MLGTVLVEFVGIEPYVSRTIRALEAIWTAGMGCQFAGWKRRHCRDRGVRRVGTRGYTDARRNTPANRYGARHVAQSRAGSDPDA